jgi:hypothetical protein
MAFGFWLLAFGWSCEFHIASMPALFYKSKYFLNHSVDLIEATGSFLIILRKIDLQPLCAVPCVPNMQTWNS